MNNENNDDFLPGVGPINNDLPNSPDNFDPNISNMNGGFDHNMHTNNFDPNTNVGVDPNMTPNQFEPNVGQVPFDMNQNPIMEPNQFDPNMNNGFDPNINANNFDPNINAGFDPNMVSNQFDSNMNGGFDPNLTPNQFDSSMNMDIDPNMGQVPFDMNQTPTMDSNQFDPSMNPNQFDPNMVSSQFDPNMNNNFDPSMNMGVDPNMIAYNSDPNMNVNNFDPNRMPNQFDPNMNGSFDPNMNNGFDTNIDNNFDLGMNQNQFDPNMNNNFEQDDSSDYNDDFVRNWMGSIYDKAHSKKFNFCAAFFGPAYLFYRKVYLTGGLTALILIIVNIIISLLKLTNIGLLLGINAVIMLIYFFGLGFGFYPIYKDFVNKQFNKYKKQIPDNNQLAAFASKKGGTSILALIVYYVVNSVVVGAVVSLMFASLMAGIFQKLPQANMTVNNNTVTNDTPFTETEDEESFVFTDGYELKYPNSTWVVSSDEKSLIKGDYTLAYTYTYKASDLGVTNISSAESRETILSIINNSVTSLATANNLQMDPNDNFVSINGTYYTYINLSSDTEITRYYFVLMPSDEILFQFELKTNDTAIQSDIHLEVTKMLTQITTASDDTTLTDGNAISNIINNTVDDNSVTNNTIADNNTIAGNTTSNEVNNVVSENNTTAGNTSSISNVLRNTSI